MRRIFLALGLLLLLFIAGLAGLLLTLDVNQYKPRITAAVRDSLHRELTITGDIALKPSLLPTLAIRGLRLGNADWASKDAMLEVQQFEARIALLPLLSRRIEISHIDIDGARLVLETAADGRGNWRMGAASAGAGASHAALPALDVGSLVVRDAVLEYRAHGRAPQVISLQTLRVRASGAQTPLEVALTLQYQQHALALSGEIAPLAQWLADASCAVNLRLHSGDLELALRGEVTQVSHAPTTQLQFELHAPSLAAVGELADIKLPALTPFSARGDLAYGADVLTLKSEAVLGKVQFNAQGELRKLASQPAMNLQVSFDAPALTQLGELFAKPLPGLAPVHGQAQLLGTFDALNIAQLQLTAARSDVGGSVRVTRDKDRLMLDAKLASHALDLSPFDPPRTAAVPRSARLFSAQPFNLSAWNQFDARFDLSAQQVLSHGLSFDSVKVSGSLVGGTLTLAPLSAGLGGGTLVSQLIIQSSRPTPHFSTQTTARNLPLAHWLDGSSGLAAPAGLASLDIRLEGQGNSVATLMAAANGHVLLDARNLEMRGKGAGLASADLLMSTLSLLNPLSHSSDTTHIECAVANFPLVSGRMQNPTGIGITTAQLRILGGGSINLDSEQLDIGVDPKPRAGLGLNMAGIADFIRIGGTLAAPTPVTDARGAATAGVKVGAAIATGGLSLLAEGLLDRNAGDVDVCAVARGEKPISGAANTAATAPDTQKPATTTAGKVVQGAGNAIKGAGNAVKGAFKSLFGH
jgi:hypothetical protein